MCVGKDERKKRKKDVSLEVENLQESVPDLRLLYRKNRKKRCLLKEYWGLFRGHLYLTSSDKVVFGKSMSVLSISLGYQLKRRERRKSVVLKNRCEIFRDNNHQSLNKKIKLYNDIECRDSGTSIRE